MSDSPEKLQQQLLETQEAVAEAQARCKRHDVEHLAVTKELEDNRSALLFMLEDLENERRKVELAHQEWTAALDVINDPIFLHDREFRILRCNRAYQQCAGIPFNELIGQTYYEVFPKIGAPLPCCLRAMEKAEEEEEEEEDIVVGKTIYRSRAFSVRDEQSAYLYSVHTLEDITESRRAQATLNESREKFRKISESAQDAVVTADDAGIIVDWNAAAERMFGHTRNEIIGQPLTVMMPERFQHPHREGLARVAAGGAPHVIGKAVELAGLRKDGSEFPLELSLAHWQVANVLFFTGIIRDITERKRTETAFREHNILIETLLENAPIGFAMNSMDDGRMTYVSRRFAEIYGIPSDTPERIKDFFEKVYRDPVFREQIRARVMADIGSGDATRMHWDDIPLVTASGETRFISASNIPLPEQNLMISTVWDVTDRYKAVAALREKEQNYRTLADSAPALIWTSGTDKLCNYFNQPWLNFTGRTLEQELGNGWTEGVHPDDFAPCVATYTESFDRREPFSMDYRLRRHDGEYRWMRDDGCPRHDSDGNFTGYIGYLMDITEHKQVEIAIQHANRALTALSTVNRSLVRATNENELLHVICRAIVEHKGYRMVWVGYRQHDENKSVRVMASAGHVEGFLDTLQISWGENERGMGPSGRAIRSGQTQVCRDLAHDPTYRPWREEALKRGYAASIALPLADSEVFGVLVVYAGEPGAFDASEIALLEEMAGDMAFGVHTLHVRQERDLTLIKNQEQLVQLQDSLEDTVRAIATIVEMRDPYTAGHQVRVADLAMTIAGQMGLPDEQVHAIHLAGIVHDLGKIQIPAEILSKPGKITDIEFSLIRIHPQAGYDILKGIDFPWPIAQMVLQHHERLDGSGYPQGLKGDTILPEARILAVADVVEAISAHRPYRAGLGIETALDEITKNRGKYYDPQVVDACVALFREQGYTFK